MFHAHFVIWTFTVNQYNPVKHCLKELQITHLRYKLSSPFNCSMFVIIVK